jgi:hypothetical protein
MLFGEPFTGAGLLGAAVDLLDNVDEPLVDARLDPNLLPRAMTRPFKYLIPVRRLLPMSRLIGGR